MASHGKCLALCTRTRVIGVRSCRRLPSPKTLHCWANSAADQNGLTTSTAAGSLEPETKMWHWRGHGIAYGVSGSGPPVLLVHGFGASGRHYRKNVPVLAEEYQVYTIDLLGFGGSDKAPVAYSMELWRDLILDFMSEYIKEPAVLVGNSTGSLAALMVGAASLSNHVKGLVLLNCAGAMNNKSLIDDWRLYLLYPLLMLIDFALKTPPVAKFLFERFASKDTIRKVLSSVYSNQEAVDDELVDIIHGPSQDQGALDVFVSVLTGPGGPRPQSLVDGVKCPILLLWGDEDPFTPLDGNVAQFFCELSDKKADVELFELEGVGHCPHDDQPDLVHKKLLPWLQAL